MLVTAMRPLLFWRLTRRGRRFAVVPGLRHLCLAVALASAAAACTPSAPDFADTTPISGGVPVMGEHRIVPGDELDVRFPFYADLNDKVTVGPDGDISLQMINTVPVRGLTAGEASTLLNERYDKVLRKPQLSVTVRTYAPELVYVDGWVATPGLLRSETPLTVSRAIAQAGGIKTAAQTDYILLLRRDKSGVVRSYHIRLGNYAGAGNPSQDMLLESYDMVYVPQTIFASVAEALSLFNKNVPFYLSSTIP
jgi:protein involved in polysaccharide export with SLBB domain